MTDRQGKQDTEILAKAREGAERLTRLEALGQRAVACPKWRWMAGMLGLSNRDSSRSIWIRVVDPPMDVDDTSEYWPDFSDPATLGCLLALVREAWGHTTLASTYSEYVDRDEWSVMPRVTEDRMTAFVSFKGTTEVEALVAALEAANQN